jgi:hypothetical protein
MTHREKVIELKRKANVLDWIEDYLENHPNAAKYLDDDMQNAIMDVLADPENIHGQKQRGDSLVAGALFYLLSKQNPNVSIHDFAKGFIAEGLANSPVNDKISFERILKFYKRQIYIDKDIKYKRTYRKKIEKPSVPISKEDALIDAIINDILFENYRTKDGKTVDGIMKEME